MGQPRPAGPRPAAALALVSGLALTAGLPLFGWWPLSLAGAGLLAWLVTDRPWRGRLLVGAAAGLGFLLPGLYWMAQFHAVGYGAAVAIEVALFAAGLTAVPASAAPMAAVPASAAPMAAVPASAAPMAAVPASAAPMAGDPARRWQLAGFPAALVLAEAARGAWPFGGVPIATLAQTQVGGPLAPAARLGGSLAVAGLVAVSGVALAAAARAAASHSLRDWGRAAAGAGLVAGVALAGFLAPRGRVLDRLEVTLVQGGGERGTRAIDTPAGKVLDAHLSASRSVPPGGDLVLWPEDVVEVEGNVSGTEEAELLSELARRLGATLVAGVVERSGNGNRNLALAWGPEGRRLDAYQKNQRVPFGEYVPLRFLIEELADVSEIGPDDQAGSEPGILPTPAGDMGVVISYEVFFPRLTRRAVRAGGEVILVPTNASSYSSTQMPALQLGATRLRALETGRAVLLAGPTGFSAVVGPDGTVKGQTDLGARTVLSAEVERRAGSTPYARLGDGPMVIGAGLVLGAAAAAGLRSRRRG